MRADLVTASQRTGLSRQMVVKDPLSLNYYHLGEEEWFVCRALDGRRSWRELQELYNRRFAPRRITRERLAQFCRQLHQAGLVLVTGTGQGAVLLQRRQQRRRRELLQAACSPLAIRFPGCHARWLLDRLKPVGDALFHPATALAVLILACCAVVLLVGQGEQLAHRFPRASDFLQGDKLIWLLVTLALVKVAHELGHALACRRLGGECHEIGLMLLAFTPCLYCDVTDSWMFPEKWKRMLVGAAGMYVELLLATLSALLWWASEPGTLNSICLNTMLVCSVGTLFFNGNPLLRYDGYYLLSDALEVPNLSEQSRDAVWLPVRAWLTGGTLPRTDCKAVGLIAYALMSLAYRWVIIGLILWATYEFLRHHQLRFLGDLLVTVTLLGVSLPPLWATGRFARHATAAGKMRRGRLIVALGAGSATLFAVLGLPLPSRVRAPLVLEMQDASYVYNQVAGNLVESLREGVAVRAGDRIARLENRRLVLMQHELEGELQQAQRSLQSLTLRVNQEPHLAAGLPAARAAVQALRERIGGLRDDVARLNVVAPHAGTLLPPPARSRLDSDADEQLAHWTGTPLDPVNRGCYLAEGGLLGIIGDPANLEGILFVHESNIERVVPGAPVAIVLDQVWGRSLRGRVLEISPNRVDSLPAPLAGDGLLPVREGDRGTWRPVQATYAVRVQLREPPGWISHRARGRARITVGYESLSRQLMHLLARTFRLRQ
jgi:putative peptide zinc metalloprotease protein